ncbi:MAG TPA: SAF domain-containing protein [Thermobifida alba]|nr:SAF domain-containing protein [Thermobifida alba]
MNTTSTPSGRPFRFRWYRWRRRLAAASAAVAAAGALLVLRPPAPPTVEVLAASRDLSGLAPLTGADTVVREVPAALAPEGALAPDHPVEGVSLRSPVHAGEILTEARLADPPAAGYGADLVAAPVRLADPGVAALLRPGSRVDVFAAGDPSTAEFPGPAAAPARTVVTDRPVIAVADAEGTPAGAGPLVVLAVTGPEARSLAGHSADRLSIAIRG